MLKHYLGFILIAKSLETRTQKKEHLTIAMVLFGHEACVHRVGRTRFQQNKTNKQTKQKNK